jgi:hypothetical protein
MAICPEGDIHPYDAVIPKHRKARVRFLQRASRCEESAPLPPVRARLMALHLEGFYASCLDHTAYLLTQDNLKQEVSSFKWLRRPDFTAPMTPILFNW